MEEYRKYAKLPLIPVVVTPDGRGLQDSTPILEQLEAEHPEPSIHPGDAPAAFVSALLEEYGDEWGNKPMFHYRWWYEPDQISAATRIARDMLGDADPAAIDATAAQLRERMVPRLSFVGSSAATRPTIEASFERQLAVLEQHLARRPYLFGARPAFGDFGLFPQLYECSTDPTPRARMDQVAPRVLAWIARMLAPRAEGPFEAWAALEPTLRPLLADEVGALFLPWSDANARAVASGQKEFTVTLGGRPWTQEAQKYHAKSLAALRARYAACPDRARLDPILRASGCLQWLQ
jgi:glutathione S-transferase